MNLKTCIFVIVLLDNSGKKTKKKLAKQARGENISQKRDGIKGRKEEIGAWRER